MKPTLVKTQIQIATMDKIAESLCKSYDANFLVEKAEKFFKNTPTIKYAVSKKLILTYKESTYVSNFKICHNEGKREHGAYNLSFGHSVLNKQYTNFKKLCMANIVNFKTFAISLEQLQEFDKYVRNVQEFKITSVDIEESGKAFVTMANNLGEQFKEALAPIPVFDYTKVPDEILTPWAKGIISVNGRDYDFFNYFPVFDNKQEEPSKSLAKVLAQNAKALIALEVPASNNAKAVYFGVAENLISSSTSKPGFKFNGYRKLVDKYDKFVQICNVTSLSFTYANRPVDVYDIEKFAKECDKYSTKTNDRVSETKESAKSVEVAPKVQSVDNSVIQSYLRTLVANGEKESMRRTSHDKEIRDILKETLKLQAENQEILLRLLKVWESESVEKTD